MALTDLDANERRVLLECLRAVAGGPFFPDWEFHTLIGVKREEMQTIVDAWTGVDETDENVSVAINNSMINLLGYPHGREKDWPKYISVSPAEVRRIFDKWRS